MSGASKPKRTYDNPLPCFGQAHIEAMSKLFADTHEGYSGSEIRHLLAQSRIEDVAPEATKWKRLHDALAENQNEHQVGNEVVKFIHEAMSPTRFTQNPERFHEWRTRLNAILALNGVSLGEDGKCRRVQRVTTVDEALARSNRLKDQLARRNVHAEVFKYCTPEIVAQNYFHTVFEAVKSIAARIRNETGLTSDGSALVDQAFSFKKPAKPLLAINALNTESLESEQSGFANLLRGLFGYVRNPLAHNAKMDWSLSELDALDMLTTVSMIHRKLDGAWKP